MSNFGALTDHFSLTDPGEALADLELIDSSKVPEAMTRGEATDENGDIAAATWHGNTDGALYAVSCQYLLKTGTLNINTIDLGELSTGVVATGIEIPTDASDWPKLTITGMLGTSAITAPSGYLNTFTLPSLTLTGLKQAQALNFTTGEGCKLQSSSFSASIELARTNDGVGEPAAFGLSGGVYTVTGNFVRITAAPSWTITDGDGTETQAPGEEEGQAAYHTGTGTYEGILTRNASA